jgi:ferredoxin
MRTERQIINIDEEKCDGCGKCAQACHEGAIQMIDGKARLVSDSYCDGLGDCIGECPRGAITFETRIAEDYDEEAVKERTARMASGEKRLRSGCPGCAVMDMRENGEKTEPGKVSAEEKPREKSGRWKLSSWPVQLRLLPENAPFLMGADLVLGADCTAFVRDDFQSSFLSKPGTVCAIGCPKLDDSEYYRNKMARIIDLNDPASITVVYMEVPCCGGMVKLVEDAIELAGRNIDLRLVKTGIDGETIEDETIRFRFQKQTKS